MDKSELARIIDAASRALKTSNDCISIHVQDGIMEVSGASSNLRIWATADTDAENFQCSTKASTILATVEKLGEDVNICRTPKGLQLESGRARVVLPVSEYQRGDVDIRQTTYSSQVKTTGLAPCVNQVLHAAELGGMDPLMSAIHLLVFVDGGFEVTALDGKRYAIRRTAEKDAELSANFVVYGHELAGALAMLGDEDITIYKPTSGSFIRLCADDLEIAISLAGPKHHDLSKLRSRKLPVRIVVEKAELERAIGLVRVTSKAGGPTYVYIDFDVNGLRVFSRESACECEMVIEARVKGINSGQTIKACYNSGFLLDALKSIQCEKIVLRLENGISPFIMTDNKFAIEMVMPIRRND